MIQKLKNHLKNLGHYQLFNIFDAKFLNMKKLTFLITAIFIILQLSAQQPLATFFTSGGEKFFIVMDGKKINTEAMSRVENVVLDNDWAKVKIIFEDEGILPIDKTIQGKDAEGNVSSVTWEISQNNKGKWVVRPGSWKKIDSNITESSTIVESEIQEEPSSVSSSTIQTTTITTEEPDNAGITSGQSNVSMSINMNEQDNSTNMNINMSVPGGTVTQTQSQSQTTYTTITTTTSTEVNESEPVYTEPDPLPGYNGRTGCNYPMSAERFSEAKESISSKDFEDTKLTVAKQVMNSNCLLASQVKQIMKLFDFESTRLDFAKQAYSHTYDLDNYYLLNDAFDFESSVTELNNHINK